MEPWFKHFLVFTIGISVIGLGITSFSSIQSAKAEKLKLTELVKEKEMAQLIKTENISTANSLVGKLESVINERIEGKKRMFEDSLKLSEKKGKETFHYDSLLVTVETVGDLVRSRKSIIERNIKVYEEGSISDDYFKKAIGSFDKDVDSLLTTYAIK